MPGVTPLLKATKMDYFEVTSAEKRYSFLLGASWRSGCADNDVPSRRLSLL